MKDRNEYTGYFADCYVLTDKRSKNFIYSFLDHFIPNRQENADEYEVPQYAERPTAIYITAEQLIEHLVNNKSDIHTIYWTNPTQSEIKGAMCIFTNDGQLIVGLYCSTKYPDTTIENKYLEELQEFCQSRCSYIAYEEPPPPNTLEFLDKVKTFHSAQT